MRWARCASQVQFGAPANNGTHSACSVLFRYLEPFGNISVVRHVDPKASGSSRLRVTRHQLFMIMIGEELERIPWVGIDQLHIDVMHRELAESENASAISHVIR